MRVVRHKADKQTDSASRVTDKGRGSILRSRVARRAAPRISPEASRAGWAWQKLIPLLATYSLMMDPTPASDHFAVQKWKRDARLAGGNRC